MRHNRPLLVLIGLCALGFLLLDWGRLVLRPADLEVSPASNALKIAISFLASVMAWRASGRGLSASDERTFRRLFVVSFLADLCFVFGQAPAGIVLFAVFQGMLARRNLAGWRAATESLRRDRVRLVGLSGGAALMMLAILGGLHQLLGFTALFGVISGYVSLLWVSLLSTWMVASMGQMPERNARRLTLGMLCFVMCDVTVGANLALPLDSLARVVSSSLTWMFYTPALVLIALSVYREESPQPAVPLPVDAPLAPAEPSPSVRNHAA
jgi:hypothetical protein